MEPRQPPNIHQDLQQARVALEGLLTVPVSREQMAALCSWAFDVLNGWVEGPEPALQEARLLQYVNIRHFQLAAGEFQKWCLRNGKIDQRAFARRVRDYEQFLHGGFEHGNHRSDSGKNRP